MVLSAHGYTHVVNKSYDLHLQYISMKTCGHFLSLSYIYAFCCSASRPHYASILFCPFCVCYILKTIKNWSLYEHIVSNIFQIRCYFCEVMVFTASCTQTIYHSVYFQLVNVCIQHLYSCRSNWITNSWNDSGIKSVTNNKSDCRNGHWKCVYSTRILILICVYFMMRRYDLISFYIENDFHCFR